MLWRSMFRTFLTRTLPSPPKIIWRISSWGRSHGEQPPEEFRLSTHYEYWHFNIVFHTILQPRVLVGNGHFPVIYVPRVIRVYYI
jgi:hypothetical protein